MKSYRQGNKRQGNNSSAKDSPDSAFRLRVLCFLLLWLLVSGCAAQTITHGIPNFQIVVPAANGYAEIDRGGEPNAEGVAYLQSRGITRSVNLDAGPHVPQMRAAFEVVNCPISFAHQFFFEPSVETICRAVDAIQPGTFVHCQHGQDRTGLVIAEYRVLRQGWSREAARKEMLANHFHWCLFGLESYWENE